MIIQFLPSINTSTLCVDVTQKKKTLKRFVQKVIV